MARIGNSTGKGRSSREAARILTRRQRVFALWSAGKLQKDIATELELTQQTVSLDVQLSLNEWREAHRGSVDEHAELELKRLNTIEMLAQEQFEETKDAKFLETMIKCGIERRKLLGVDKPSRTEIKADVTLSRTFKPKQEMLQDVRRMIEQFRKSRQPSDN